MDKRRETGIVLIFGLVLMLIIALSALFSCTTKQKVVTEYITVHDTIRTHKTDTLREVSYQVRVDTVRQTETHTITLNNVGDTIKEIHHYHDTEKVIVVDSTDRYKATVDSLRAALEREHNRVKEATRTKRIIPWYTWMAIAIIVGVLGIAAFKAHKT